MPLYSYLIKKNYSKPTWVSLLSIICDLLHLTWL